MAAFVAVRANAQTSLATGAPAAGPGAVWVFTTTFVSQDLFRGYYLGGPSIEPSLDLGNGVYDLGFWSNSTVRNRVQGPSSTEIELYGSYVIQAIRDALSVEPGFTLYALPWGPGFYGLHRVSVEPSLGLNFSVAGIQLAPKVYDDLVLKVVTCELNAAYAVPLRAVRTELDLTASYGADVSTFVSIGAPAGPRTWSTYWLLQVAAPFQVGKRGTFTLGWCYTGSAYGEPGAFALGGHPVSSRGLVTASYAIKL